MTSYRRMRRQARQIRRGRYRGLLHGIPYGAKDLLATRAIPTTWGAEPYRHQVFDHDATIIRKLRAAGAILVAKLAKRNVDVRFLDHIILTETAWRRIP